MLRRYGYITDNYSTHDVAEISTELIISAFRNGNVHSSLAKLSPASLKLRLELAEREGVCEESFDLLHPGPDEPGIPDELLAFLYILLVNEDHLKAIFNSQSNLPSRSKLATELAGEVLKILLQTREKEYSTTVEEDEHLLRDANLPLRTGMAIQVRLGEKYVLRAAIQEVSTFTGSNQRMRLAPSKATTERGGKRKAEDFGQARKKGRSR